MKYLYKILRFFFCPHKYKKILNEGQYVVFLREDPRATKTIKGTFYDKECCYCGKVKRFGKIQK